MKTKKNFIEEAYSLGIKAGRMIGFLTGALAGGFITILIINIFG